MPFSRDSDTTFIVNNPPSPPSRRFPSENAWRILLSDKFSSLPGSVNVRDIRFFGLIFGVLDGDEKAGSVCVLRSTWVFSSRGMARGLLPRRGGTGGGRVLGGIVGGGVQGE